jgi:hypothetical protein
VADWQEFIKWLCHGSMQQHRTFFFFCEHIRLYGEYRSTILWSKSTKTHKGSTKQDQDLMKMH